MTSRPTLLQKMNLFYACGEWCYSGVSPDRIERRCGGYATYVGRVARDFDELDVAEDSREAVWQLLSRIGPRKT